MNWIDWTIIVVWVLGMVISYRLFRIYTRYDNDGRYTGNDRVMGIFLSIISSWLSVIILGALCTPYWFNNADDEVSW